MVLLGLRAGWIAFAVSVLMMAISAALAEFGSVAFGQAIQAGDATIRYWAFQGINLLVPLLTIMILLTQFLRLQTRTMAAERQALRKLEDEIATRRQCEAEIARIGEDERRRLGAELHDGLCQQLTAALLHCTTVEHRLSAQNLPEAALVGRLRAMIEEAIGTSYDVSKGLCLVDLSPEGLVSALERLARQTQAVSGISCRLQSEGRVTLKDPQTALNLFRIAQEAVANAVKHANGRAIQIAVQAAADVLTLRVQDDGAGLQASAGRSVGGMGLRLMAHRAAAMGGQLTFEHADGGGTVVSCRVPVESE
jgi:signal transduction histidine kinase